MVMLDELCACVGLPVRHINPSLCRPWLLSRLRLRRLRLNVGPPLLDLTPLLLLRPTAPGQPAVIAVADRTALPRLPPCPDLGRLGRGRARRLTVLES